MDKERPLGRLAFREENDLWVAYYKFHDESFFLGAINMRAVVKDEKAKMAFMELMKTVVSNLVEKFYGVKPDWKSPVLVENVDE